MTIAIKPEQEATLALLASSTGITPDEVISRILETHRQVIEHKQRQAELIREGISIRTQGLPIGANIPASALTSEGIYE